MADKILVIDDDLDSLKLIGLLLQRQGYDVSAAPGGSQGLAQAESENPDLILLDIMMPDMDGYEVCRRLRKNPRLAHIPVIMFTAKTGVEDKITGFDAGADDYLTKPTHPAELASRVKALLARSAVIESTLIPQSKGQIIAVLGVKGGSGVSTTAVNLAVTLASQENKLVLADLQHGMGAIGLQLGYLEGASLSNLLQLRLDELNTNEMEKELIEYSTGLQLLLAEFNPTDAAMTVPPSHVRRIVDLLAQMADQVILDLGNKVDNTSLQALQQADHILLCLAPHRTSRSMAQMLLRHLGQYDIPRDRMSGIIVNTSAAGPDVDLPAIETQLRLQLLGVISAAPELANSSAEQAKPMVSLQPQSQTANEFREISKQISAKLEVKPPAE